MAIKDRRKNGRRAARGRKGRNNMNNSGGGGAEKQLSKGSGVMRRKTRRFVGVCTGSSTREVEKKGRENSVEKGLCHG